MEFFFDDPNETRLPPEDVRIRDLRCEPWPDGRRIKVNLEVDPTQQRPSVELTILNPQGAVSTSTSILESMSRKMEVNMHLRGDIGAGYYSLQAMLFFASLPEAESETLTELERLVVDNKQVVFHLETQS